MTERPVHSPLGASGAERWMNCPGSVALLNALQLPESDEPEYRSLGTSAHAAGHKCLTMKLDAWEVVGEKFGVHEVDSDMAMAVQEYLDEVKSIIDGASADAKIYFEFGVDAPDFHKQFYGTLDCGVVDGNVMRIRDYKHGEGISVQAEWNRQLMYYAYGLLRHHPEVELVELKIIQPRISWQIDEPWTITADELRAWAENELLPAMLRTEMDDDLNPGSWCRFCPAKLVCGVMTSLFGAAMNADPKQIVNLSDESLGRSYQYIEAVEFYIKALEDETYRRLNTGKAVPGTKMVLKKANRVLKDGAAKVFAELYPVEAFTEPKLKTPAELEKIGPTAKKLVHEWAYTPNNGLTVAMESDKRPGVKVVSIKESFAATVAALQEG